MFHILGNKQTNADEHRDLFSSPDTPSIPSDADSNFRYTHVIVYDFPGSDFLERGVRKNCRDGVMPLDASSCSKAAAGLSLKASNSGFGPRVQRTFYVKYFVPLEPFRYRRSP